MFIKIAIVGTAEFHGDYQNHDGSWTLDDITEEDMLSVWHEAFTDPFFTSASDREFNCYLPHNYGSLFQYI